MSWFEKWHSQSWLRHAAFASLFWGGLAGLFLVWPVFMTIIPVWAFVLGGVTISAALAAAKYLKRPGTE